MSTVTPTASRGAASLAGKYLTFVLGEESYGIAVLKIREIIRLPDITAVPQMPSHIRGVINLRGKIIPVVDLRARFGLPNADATDRTCVIVMQVASSSGSTVPMGLVVDDVEEVINLSADDIQETPDFGSHVETDYLLGMAKIKGVVKTLLDFDKVVTDVPSLELSPSTTTH
ncbi:MAG: purine-binding chemotaxis protein CheW [Verrucomicrobiales bacterium]|nr:purine-binding chemotaxis protein CheW [Verrucomicrobiales bacterium]